MGRGMLACGIAASALAGSLAPAAADYAWRNVVIGGGGYVDGIVFHPKVKGLMYARTDMGGAYRWDPASSSWVPITDWIGPVSDNMGILSIALDPNDASKVYLLTGMYTNAWTSEPGYLLASGDTGKTFGKTRLHLKNGANLDGRGMGERLAVDPHQGKILLLAGSGWDTSSGGVSLGHLKGALWRSTDGGASFDSLATGPVGNGTFALFDPASGTDGSPTRTLYVGMDSSDAGSPALWRSKDGGTTWAVVPGAPAGLIPTHAAIRGTTAYFSFNDGVGPNGVTGGKLMRLNTRDDTWTEVSPERDAAFGFGSPGLDAQDPSRLVVSSIDRWGEGDDVWLSRDGGGTWSSTLRSGRLDLSSAPWKSARTPHWISSVQIDPFDSNAALFGTGYGVFRTTSLLSAVPEWAAADSNLEECVSKNLVSPPAGVPLVSSLGDQGGFRHASLDKAPSSFHLPDAGTTMSIDVAWQHPSVYVRGHLPANAAGTFGGYSLDSAKTWTSFPSQPAGLSAAEGGGTRSLALSSDGSAIVWTAPGTSGAHVSRDRGRSWSLCGGPAPVPGTSTPHGDKATADLFYILDPQNGRVLVSKDGGASFAQGGDVLKLDAWESNRSEIAAVPGYAGHVLVAADHDWGGGGLYLSVDTAASFAKLPGVSGATRVGVGKAAPGKRFPAVFLVGTINSVYGFFRSDDSCKTWTRINDAQHQYGTIHQIVGDPNVYGRVFLGTEGRGIVYGEPAETVVGTASRRCATAGGILRQGSRLLSRQGSPVRLFDLDGRLVRTSQPVAAMDLSGLPHGMYLARSAGRSLPVAVTE